MVNLWPDAINLFSHTCSRHQEAIIAPFLLSSSCLFIFSPLTLRVLKGKRKAGTEFVHLVGSLTIQCYLRKHSGQGGV